MPAVTWDVVRPSLPGSVTTSKWKQKWLCMAASDPADLFIAFSGSATTSSPLGAYVLLRLPTFPIALQHLCNHLGSAGAVLLVRPRNSLCKPCSSRIFSCSIMGMLLAGKEACSKCASSPSTACATE